MRNDATVQRPRRLPRRADRGLRRRLRPMGAGRVRRGGPLHPVARTHGRDRDRRRIRPLPRLRRPRRPRPGPRRGHGQPVRLAVHPARVLRRQGGRPGPRGAVQLRQLRRRRAELRRRPGSAEGGGDRLPHGAGHRRHLERPAGRVREASRHRRRPHGLQGRRRRRRGGRLPRRGRAAGPAHQRPHPVVRRRLRRLHPARQVGARCSRCRKAGWRSGSASTASPASTRPTCRPRTSSPSCSSRGCCRRCPRASRCPAPAWCRSSTAWAA